MRKILSVASTLVLLLALSLTASAQSGRADVLGKWKTIDDETGKARSIVELYRNGNAIEGRVVELFREPNEEQNPICDECDEDDSRYNKPVRGMTIITGMVWDADDAEYDDGEILDPKNGSIYDCVLWREGDKLMVRGYLGFIYRTQTWQRVQ